MKDYAQCRISISEADESERMWRNAKGVITCDFDLSGDLRREP